MLSNRSIDLTDSVYEMLRSFADFGENPNDTVRRLLRARIARSDVARQTAERDRSRADTDTSADRSTSGGFTHLIKRPRVGCTAWGKALPDGGMRVLAGSKLVRAERDSLNSQSVAQRQRRKQRGLGNLREVSDSRGRPLLELLSDVDFPSVSSAASFVTGTSTNGNVTWVRRSIDEHGSKSR